MMKNIHGHTKIELTNVNTGEVKTVEDNNMVTNAIELMLNAPYENMPNTANPSKLWNYLSTDPKENVKNLTQGLILFQDAIIEDPNQIDPPAGNNVVGLGAADMNYNGSILEYGSYNSTESKLFPADNPKYVKYVWDFSTSQGNGVINCACLTTKLGGKMGYGVKSVDSNIYMTTANQFPVGASVYGTANQQNGILINCTKRDKYSYNNLQFLWVDLDKEDQYLYTNERAQIHTNDSLDNIICFRGYYKTWNTYEVNTQSYHSGLEEPSVNSILIRKSSLNKDHYELSSNLSYSGKIEDITIPIPEEILTALIDAKTNLLNSTPTDVSNNSDYGITFKAYTSKIFVTENNLYMCFLPFSSSRYTTGKYQWDYDRVLVDYCPWRPGETLYILKIEKNTWNTSYEKLTNTTNKIFCLPYCNQHSANSGVDISPFYLTDKYILLADTNYNIYIYDKIEQEFKKCKLKHTDKIMNLANYQWYSFYLEKEERIILYKAVGMTDNWAPAVDYSRIIELSTQQGSYHNYTVANFIFNFPNRLSSSYSSDHYTTGDVAIPVYKHSFFRGCRIYGTNGGSDSTLYNWAPQIADFSHIGNPMLMTINNLPEPVEKTEEYTMKVTYELTWD